MDPIPASMRRIHTGLIVNQQGGPNADTHDNAL